MDTEELHMLFYAFWDAGILLSFGRDCVTNIPQDSDPDDTGWHLMFPDMSMFKGKMDIFDRIVEERGLEVKQETHLGLTYVSIYRPGYRVSLDRQRPPMNMRTTKFHFLDPETPRR